MYIVYISNTPPGPRNKSYQSREGPNEEKGVRNSSAFASSSNLKLFDKTSSRHLCVGMY